MCVTNQFNQSSVGRFTDRITRSARQARRSDANTLAFWMANASEYLHFLKQDRHISPYSVLAQDILAESVQAAFRWVGHCPADGWEQIPGRRMW